MIPGALNLEVYRGDTFRGPLIALPALTPFGGPSTLAGCTVTAHARKKLKDALPAFEFFVEIIDEDERTLRLWLESTDTDDPAPGSYFWDLEVASTVPTPSGTWVGSPLAGVVSVTDQVTREP